MINNKQTSNCKEEQAKKKIKKQNNEVGVILMQRDRKHHPEEVSFRLGPEAGEGGAMSQVLEGALQIKDVTVFTEAFRQEITMAVPQ